MHCFDDNDALDIVLVLADIKVIFNTAWLHLDMRL